MAKAKAVDETTTMVLRNIRKKDVEAIRQMVKQLVNDDKPRKPIKRIEKVSKADFVKVNALVKQLAPLVKKLNNEFNRLSELELNDLAPKDEMWLDEYINRVDAALGYITEKTETTN